MYTHTYTHNHTCTHTHSLPAKPAPSLVKTLPVGSEILLKVDLAAWLVYESAMNILISALPSWPYIQTICCKSTHLPLFLLHCFQVLASSFKSSLPKVEEVTYNFITVMK